MEELPGLAMPISLFSKRPAASPFAIRKAGRVSFVPVLLLLLLSAQITHAQDLRFQLESISIKGDYQLGMFKKEGVNSVKGYGGGAEVRFRIHDYASIYLGVGYGHFDISESDPITKWDWAYWIRNYRNYVVLLLRDSAYFDGRLQTLKAISNERLTAGKWTGKDSVYSVRLTPVEYMNTIPVTLSFAFLYSLTKTIQIDAHLSSTLFVFEKNLYLDEKWEKRRVPDAGPDSGKAYYFSYGFRNFAPPKKGKALGFGGGIGVQAELFSFISFRVGAQYETYDRLFKGWNYNVLPFRHRFSFGAGFAVNY